MNPLRFLLRKLRLEEYRNFAKPKHALAILGNLFVQCVKFASKDLGIVAERLVAVR